MARCPISLNSNGIVRLIIIILIMQLLLLSLKPYKRYHQQLLFSSLILENRQVDPLKIPEVMNYGKRTNTCNSMVT